MASIFSKIIAGEIPCYRVAENDKFLAFLDIFPVQKGHTLVIPKLETDKIFDLPDEYLAEILLFAKPIAKAIEKSFPCNRVNILTVGLEVPHAHIHLLPTTNPGDVDLSQPKLKFTKEEFSDIIKTIQANME